MLLIVGLRCFFSYIPVNHGFWLHHVIFYFFNDKLVESKALYIGCIDQQSRFDGCSSLLAMECWCWVSGWRNAPQQTTYRVIRSGHAINVQLKPAGSGINSQNGQPGTLTLPITASANRFLFPRCLSSFPAITAWCCLPAFMWRYFGKGTIALGFIILCFAFRVMIGAHWFTDIIVGSMTDIDARFARCWRHDRLITFLTNHYRETSNNNHSN